MRRSWRWRTWAIAATSPSRTADRGRRNWRDSTSQDVVDRKKAQAAVYRNRRRMRGDYGKALHRKRGELVERAFAHVLDTGGMRRAHLKGRENLHKRYLIHVAGFNLSLVMRKLVQCGTPRELAGLFLRIAKGFWRQLFDRSAWWAVCRPYAGLSATLIQTNRAHRPKPIAA